MNILVAGCGDVGTALGLELVDVGHRVYALRRNVSALPNALLPVAADLCDPGTLGELPEVDYLFYTATPDGRSDEAYARTFVAGLENTLNALSGRGLRHVYFVSSTGVYAQCGGEWVDESSDTCPEQFSGVRLLQGERVALDAAFPGTVVRFGGIYGPGRTRLIERVRAGTSCIVDPPRFTNRIHRDDCAGVLKHLLSLESPESVYLGVDSEPAAQCVVFDWLAHRLGAPRPLREAGDADMDQGKRCSNARLLESGYAFQYPTFREGYSSVIEGLSGSVQAGT